MDRIVYELVSKITGIKNLYGSKKYFKSVILERIDDIETKQYTILDNIKLYIEEKLLPSLKFSSERRIVRDILLS